MKKNYLIILAVFCTALFSMTVSAQKLFNLKSPNGKEAGAVINVGKTIDYSVLHNGDLMLDKSTISMSLSDGTFYGKDAKLSGSSTKSVNQIISAQVYKRKQIKDNYNELTPNLKITVFSLEHMTMVLLTVLCLRLKSLLQYKANRLSLIFPADSKSFYQLYE